MGFRAFIAASATDIRAALTVTLESTLPLPCILDRESTIREWLADPQGQAVFGPMYAQMEAQSRKIFGGLDGNVIGMDILDMFKDMPLLSVLLFQQSSLPMPVEELLDSLLMQAHGMEPAMS